MIFYYELTPTPAVPTASIQPGDRFAVNWTSQQIQHQRGAAVLGTYGAASWPGVSLGEYPPIPSNAGPFKVVYAKEQHMPGQNVSMIGVSENQSTGAVTLKYSTGNQVEYADWATVGSSNALDETPDLAERLLALKAFRASPDGANKTTQVGAAVSVNGLADTPIVYTEAQ